MIIYRSSFFGKSACPLFDRTRSKTAAAYSVYTIDRTIFALYHVVMWHFAYLLDKTIKITWRPRNGKVPEENLYTWIPVWRWKCVIISFHAKFYVEARESFNLQFVYDFVTCVRPSNVCSNQRARKSNNGYFKLTTQCKKKRKKKIVLNTNCIKYNFIKLPRSNYLISWSSENFKSWK